MEDEARNNIIDDLLRKTPTCEYTDDELFDLGFRSRIAVEGYVCKRFFGVSSPHGLKRKKATVTRRTKRIWERISESVRAVQSAGGAGVYSVRQKYRYAMPAFGFIHAKDMPEADAVAKVMFGFLLDDPSKMEVIFVERTGPRAIDRYNSELEKTYQKKIDDAISTKEAASKNIELLTNRLDYLKNFSSTIFE